MLEKRDDIDQFLRQHGVRVTQARRAVYAALSASDAPLLISQIFESLERTAQAIDLVTVYRTIDTLEQCGLVVRIDRLGDGWRYAPRSSEHQHLIVCSRCGTRAPLDTCELERMDRMLEQTTGFRDIHHSLQFFGTCPECQQNDSN